MRKNYAYLEQAGGEWLDDFVYMSKEPLIELGFEIRPFDGDDLENTLTCYPLDLKYDVIIGGVGATNIFFKECGIETPEYLGYPKELNKYEYMGRYVDDCKLSDVTRIFNLPVFIKPMRDVKLFTGFVMEKESDLDFIQKYIKHPVPDDTEVYVSEVLPPIVAEYRCFVHEGKLTGIQYYQGDFTVYPTIRMIEDMIDDYESANCAYTLDVGVMEHGITLLIEVNDMWAIGSYGMNAKDYTLACVRRMREIGRQANGETESLWKKLKRRYN